MAVLASHRLIGWPVSRKPQRPSLLDSPAVVLDGGAYAAAQARGHSPDWPRSCDASCGGAAGGKNPRWSLAALAAGLGSSGTSQRLDAHPSVGVARLTLTASTPRTCCESRCGRTRRRAGQSPSGPTAKSRSRSSTTCRPPGLLRSNFRMSCPRRSGSTCRAQRCPSSCVIIASQNDRPATGDQSSRAVCFWSLWKRLVSTHTRTRSLRPARG